jgi:hypothetical protein
MGGDTVGTFVDDASGQEDQLPFCGTQCGFAKGGIKTYIPLEQYRGIREGGVQVWDESETFLHLF